jgi:hypothetical protein
LMVAHRMLFHSVCRYDRILQGYAEHSRCSFLNRNDDTVMSHSKFELK